jgi:ribose transport system substrate-binding protein
MSAEENHHPHRIEDPNPVSRRVFMRLAAHAGVAIPAASALGNSAWAADPTPKATTIVATLANDYWAAFINGFKATAVALKVDTQELYHDNAAARQVVEQLLKGLSERPRSTPV